MTGSDSRRRKAQAVLGERSDGTMQFKTINSPQQHENIIQAASAAETKSVPVDTNQDEDSAATITTYWNLQQEVEKLKEANNIQVRDGQSDEAQANSAEDGEYHEIHYGRETGSNLGIYILPSDEDHSSSVTEEELRIEEEVPNTPYHIFHKKDSGENTATGNYGSYTGGNSSPPASGGGSSSSTSGSSSSGIDNIFGDSYGPEESQLRDVLNNVKELGANVNIAVHQKTSAEKDGFNDPFRAPSNFEFYNPGAVGGPTVGDPNGEEGLAPPRGNDGPTSMPTVFGKRNCKATNGVFGDNRQERSGGGVTLKFQYELNTDATPGGPFQRASLYNEILPALEDTMVTTMLPAFFSDECMRIPSGSFSRKKKVRGRYLRGGGEVEDENQIELVNGFDPEEELTFGYQHQHRRLNRVIGIDSDPMDFPLPNEDCNSRIEPLDSAILPKCYVMEGAMTVYFPENFNFRDLVTGAQLTALNTIKEGMEMGTISEMAHPAILGLTFLESSYSLRPLLPGGLLPVAPVEAPPPPPPEKSGNGNVGLIVGIIIVLIVFVIFAGCFFRYRLRQEQAKLEAMMRDNAKKKKKKKKKSDNVSDQSSDGTPADPTSLYILNRYAANMQNSEDDDDADDEDNLTDREKEIHQRLKKRRKTKKKMRRASYASNLSSNHDGSFSTLNDSDQNLMEYYANMTVSSTQGSKTTTSSDSTTDVSGSESSTTSHSQTFHTKSTSTSDDHTTTSDSGTTSSAGTTSDSDDDSEEEDTFDMNDMNFNLGGAGGNFSNGATRTQPPKRKGRRSNLIMTGDDDMSVGTETTGATEAVSNLSRNRGGAFGGGYGGGGGASVATEVMGNTGRGGGGLYGEYGGDFSGGASAAPSVDFSAATEAMGNLGRGRNIGGGGFSGGASAAPSVDFSAATEAMGNLGRGRNIGGGGFSGGASAAPSVDFSAATEAMGNLGRGRNFGGGGFSGGASAAPSVDFSAATEAMGNLRGRGPVRMSAGASAAPSVDYSAATEAMSNRRRAVPSSGGSAGAGASVAMSAATEAIKNTGRAKKPQQMESIGELTFSDF